ncbi:MAG: hypothetical protein FWH21_03005, partial [Kiritimatiellaeota bacterium]|nr:hypothetical protein [Kiritimatiellota bacterium]
MNTPASLDPDFIPLFCVYTSLQEEAAHARKTVQVRIACVRDGGDCDTFEMDVADPMGDTATRFCERVVKFMLWASGGHEIHISAPGALSQHIAAAYAPGGGRAFDCGMMAAAYGRPLP